MLDQKPKPWLLKYRSNTLFIIATVAIGLFTDLFLYGLIVPVLPFMLHDRVAVPSNRVQSYVSGLLAAYAGASMLFSLPAGWLADRTNSRQSPFLAGLAALLAATIMFALGKSIAVLVVARILQGMSGAIVWTVGFAMVLDTVGPQHLGKVIGSIFSVISVGSIMSPVLGGILYDKTGYIGVFGVGAGILGLDFVMRVMVIEKKVAAKFGDDTNGMHSQNHDSREEETEDEGEADEGTALLGNRRKEDYKVPDGQNRIIRAFPILYCFSNPRVAVAHFLALVQASILGVFDATVPTEAKSLLGFSSLEVGLIFIALDIPYLLLGPVAGWAVDKYGTKPVAVLGYAYLVPTLVLLRLPASSLVTTDQQRLILWCSLLALTGVGMAVIGSPSLVEASDVVQKYHKANPGFFGENGPYAQLYGFQSLVFCAGLTLGPIVSGTLRDAVGYGNMNIFFAAVSGLAAILSLAYIGGKPSWKKLAKPLV